MSEIPAGRELDALIAEKVMGQSLASFCDYFKGQRCDGKRLTRCNACGAQGHGNCYGPGRGGALQVDCENVCSAPSFSTDIAAAWLVVGKLRESGRVLTLSVDECGFPGGEWRCFMQWDVESGDNEGHCWADGQTAPLAICRAALKAVAP